MVAYPVTEFETVIEQDGKIQLPIALNEKFKTGSHVTVRLTLGGISSPLKKRGVTENEVEQIARVQLEEREDVLRFLNAEGALRNNKGFCSRAKKLLAERT